MRAKFLLLFVFLLSVASLGIAKDIALSQLSDSFEALAETVSPSVVQIFSTGYSGQVLQTQGAVDFLQTSGAADRA